MLKITARVSNIAKWPCAVCGHPFDRAAAPLEFAVHDGEELVGYACETCGRGTEVKAADSLRLRAADLRSKADDLDRLAACPIDLLTEAEVAAAEEAYAALACGGVL